MLLEEKLLKLEKLEEGGSSGASTACALLKALSSPALKRLSILGFPTLAILCFLYTYSYVLHLCTLKHVLVNAAAAAAKSLQSCLTLCNPVPGILQASTLEWVAISFSSSWKWQVKVKLLSHVWLLATPWAAAYQAPPSMEFSRQEYWSGMPLPSPLILYLFSGILMAVGHTQALLIWVLRWMTLQHTTFSYNVPISLSKRPAWHCPFEDLEKSYISWLTASFY